MLNVIVNITSNVAAGLKTRIKTFGQRGLSGMYLRRENVKRMVLNISSIPNTLNQLSGVLPEDIIADIVQGLPLASHLKFAKIFADCTSDLKNPLMKGVELEGNTAFEKTSTVLATALKTYALYCLSIGPSMLTVPPSLSALSVIIALGAIGCLNARRILTRTASLPTERHAMLLLVVMLKEMDVQIDVEVAVTDATDEVDVVVAALGEVKEMDLNTVEEGSPIPM